MEAGDLVVIGRRFNGPPDSANGGYAAGLLGQALDGVAEVTLRTPPPLDTPLRVLRTADAAVLALAEVPDDGTAIAEARLVAPVDVEPPVRPDVDTADEAASRHAGIGVRHVLSDCVVCGPDRPDGFRLHTGPLKEQPGIGAAVWRPDASLAAADGTLPPEVMWAALDCPGFTPPMWDAFLRAGALVLLGRFAASLERTAHAGDTLVAVGWGLGSEGRKHHTASALLTPDGEVVGRARATWIQLRPATSRRIEQQRPSPRQDPEADRVSGS